MTSFPLMIALWAAPVTEGLAVGGAALGQPVTLASLQAAFPGATCDPPPVPGGSGRWLRCRVPILFAGRAVIAEWVVQPDGYLHAIELPLPATARSRAKAVFERQYGRALDSRRKGEMLYFGVCRQTALAVFSRQGELYVTYTWLQGNWKPRDVCP